MSEIQSSDVDLAISKVVNRPVDYGWLTDELARAISKAAVNAANAQACYLVSEGTAPAVAAAVADTLVLPLAFNLGLYVGREMAQSTSFTDMMLGLGGFSDSPTDAGEPEHGGE